VYGRTPVPGGSNSGSKGGGESGKTPGLQSSSGNPGGAGTGSGGLTGAIRGVARPTVTNPKLGNLVKDLYKGANTKNPIGTGSTADAIRQEMATGEAVGGRFHTQKGTEYVKALENWLTKNAGASAADRSAAQSILEDLRNALAGK